MNGFLGSEVSLRGRRVSLNQDRLAIWLRLDSTDAVLRDDPTLYARIQPEYAQLRDPFGPHDIRRSSVRPSTLAN